MKTMVLIGCGALKQDKQCQAKDLYKGALFQKAYAYAQRMNPEKIFILSAKHHLLNPDKEVAPYNETLNGKNVSELKGWSGIVLNQLKEEGVSLEKDKIVILSGKNYYKYLLPHIKHYELPYQGCKGIGYILHFLNEQIKNDRESI